MKKRYYQYLKILLYVLLLFFVIMTSSNKGYAQSHIISEESSEENAKNTAMILNIISPSEGSVTQAGPIHAPTRLLIQVEVRSSSYQGVPVTALNPQDFTISVGDITIYPNQYISTLYIQNQYWFLIQLPPQPIPGSYNLIVNYANKANDVERGSVHYRAADTGEEGPLDIHLVPTLPHADRLLGRPLPMVAYLSTHLSAPDITLQLSLKAPNHQESTLRLFDDGQHGDGVSGDGIYGGIFYRTHQPGRYLATVTVGGIGDTPIQKEFPLVVQNAPDDDGDGLPTWWEMQWGTNPYQPDAADDPDMEGLSNDDEYRRSTDPFNSDSDHGGESDQSDPNPLYPDDDRISCAIEFTVTPLFNWLVQPTLASVRLEKSPTVSYTTGGKFKIWRTSGLNNPWTVIATDTTLPYLDHNVSPYADYHYKIQEFHNGHESCIIGPYSSKNQLWFPLIAAHQTPVVIQQPDLIIDSITSIAVEPQQHLNVGEEVTLEVVIKNVGNTIAPANFWVDLYINPKESPTEAGHPWKSLCQYDGCPGLAWQVTKALAPGESITLLSQPSSAYLSENDTRWDGLFHRGGTKQLWAYVDSWNGYGDPNGFIIESDEGNNQGGSVELQVTDAPHRAISIERESVQEIRERPLPSTDR